MLFNHHMVFSISMWGSSFFYNRYYCRCCL